FCDILVQFGYHFVAVINSFRATYVWTQLLSFIFFLRNLPQPSSTLFPYTTLFRSRTPSGGAACRRGSSRARRPRARGARRASRRDRKSTRLNSSHGSISYAVFCLKKKKITILEQTVFTKQTVVDVQRMRLRSIHTI